MDGLSPVGPRRQYDMGGRRTAQIAVIVPVYNNEKVVQRCIDSVLGQTYADLELILVDDGSKDGSGAICDAAAAADARVKVIHKPNEGLMATWMRGVRESSAPYLAFVDGDDWIDPEMMEKMHACLKAAAPAEAAAEAPAAEGPDAAEGTRADTRKDSRSGKVYAFDGGAGTARRTQGQSSVREIVCCSYVIDREWNGTSEERTHGAAPGVYEGAGLQKEIREKLLGN